MARHLDFLDHCSGNEGMDLALWGVHSSFRLFEGPLSQVPKEIEDCKATVPNPGCPSESSGGNLNKI